MLIGYIATKNNHKATQIIQNLQSIDALNVDFADWLKKVSQFLKGKNSEVSVIEEYEEIFNIMGEPEDYMYNPSWYIKIFQNASRPRQRAVRKIPGKYNSVVK